MGHGVCVIAWLLCCHLTVLVTARGGSDFTKDRLQNAQDNDSPDPTSSDVNGMCSDSRATNYGSNATGTTDNLCLYPILRTGPSEWTSMPLYCNDGNFDWKGGDIAECYTEAQMFLPPWKRDFNCSVGDCTQSLEIDVLNMRVAYIDFPSAKKEKTVSVEMTYVLQWTDQRLFGGVLRDTSKVWVPEMQMDLYISSRGDISPLEIISSSVVSENPLVYMDEPLCSKEEINTAQSTGQDQSCCLDKEDCHGRVVALSDVVECDTFDSCKVTVAKRIIVEAKRRDIDVSKLPYDTHTLKINAYIANPYHSTDLNWWREFKPKPPIVVFHDYGTNQPTEYGSLAASLKALSEMQFDLTTTARIIYNTSLAYYMRQGDISAYKAILDRAHTGGVGGAQVYVKLTRKTAYLNRFFLFPMILVGSISIATALLNDNAIEQVSNRLGFGAIAILTAFSSTLMLSTFSIDSIDQLTVLDQVNIVMILFGGLVSLEALASYAWWRKRDCDANQLWTCWFVQAMDQITAIWCVTLYLYVVGIIVLISKITLAAQIWGGAGFALVAIVIITSGYCVYRWSLGARINNSPANWLEPSQVWTSGTSKPSNERTATQINRAVLAGRTGRKQSVFSTLE